MNPDPTQWQAGNVPQIPEGTKKRYIVALQRGGGGHCTFELIYLNRYVMACADHLEPPADAEPIGDGEDEYYWTGWHEDHCEQCETMWTYNTPEKIIAFMPTPKYNVSDSCIHPNPRNAASLIQ